MLQHQNKLDTQFFGYWEQLNDNQKISLLNVAANYISIEETNEIDETFLKEYNEDISKAEEEIEKGNFYSHEEVMQMLSKKYG